MYASGLFVFAFHGICMITAALRYCRANRRQLRVAVDEPITGRAAPIKLRERLVQPVLGAGHRSADRAPPRTACRRVDIRIASANSSSAAQIRPARAAAADDDRRRIDAVHQHAVAADGRAAEVERVARAPRRRRASAQPRPRLRHGNARDRCTARARATPPSHPAASSAITMRRRPRASGTRMTDHARRGPGRHRQRHRIAEQSGRDRQACRRDGRGA